MKRLLVLSALAFTTAAIGLSVRTARAGTDTNTLTVTATVLGLCSIDPATLAFGDYDPTVATTDASATITVKCTSGSSYWIGLGLGSNASGTTRRMAGGNAEFLAYELYRDAPGGTVWDNAAVAPSLANDPAAGPTAYTTTVFGRILGGQAVSTGNYSDSVTMTVNF